MSLLVPPDAEQVRLKGIYDNLLGLAAAGVVTGNLSADELAEGLKHCNLNVASKAELDVFVRVVDEARRGETTSFKVFLEEVAAAGAPTDSEDSEEEATDQDHAGSQEDGIGQVEQEGPAATGRTSAAKQLKPRKPKPKKSKPSDKQVKVLSISAANAAIRFATGLRDGKSSRTPTKTAKEYPSIRFQDSPVGHKFSPTRKTIPRQGRATGNSLSPRPGQPARRAASPLAAEALEEEKGPQEDLSSNGTPVVSDGPDDTEELLKGSLHQLLAWAVAETAEIVQDTASKTSKASQASLSRRMTQLEVGLRSAVRQAQEIQRKNDSLQATLEAEHASTKTLNLTINDLKTRLEESEANLEAESESVKTLNMKVHELRSRLEESEVEKLRAIREAQDAAIARAEEQISKTLAEASRLSSTARALVLDTSGEVAGRASKKAVQAMGFMLFRTVVFLLQERRRQEVLAHRAAVDNCALTLRRRLRQGLRDFSRLSGSEDDVPSAVLSTGPR